MHSLHTQPPLSRARSPYAAKDILISVTYAYVVSSSETHPTQPRPQLPMLVLPGGAQPAGRTLLLILVASPKTQTARSASSANCNERAKATLMSEFVVGAACSRLQLHIVFRSFPSCPHARSVFKACKNKPVIFSGCREARQNDVELP